MSNKHSVLQDWSANRGDARIQIALLLLRCAQRARASTGVVHRLMRVPLAAVYRGYALSVVGIDIPVSTTIGPGLKIFHGIGLVVHNDSVIGSGVTLRQCSTVGEQHAGGGAPVLGDGVEVGSNALVLGDIEVGAGVRIGAGAVVTKSIPVGAVVVGNPAREIDASSHVARPKVVE